MQAPDCSPRELVALDQSVIGSGARTSASPQPTTFRMTSSRSTWAASVPESGVALRSDLCCRCVAGPAPAWEPLNSTPTLVLTHPCGNDSFATSYIMC